MTFDEMPVYKQEHKSPPNDQQLLMFGGGELQGWFIASCFFQTMKEMDSAGGNGNIVAWLQVMDYMPHKMHIPFWSQEPLHGASFTTAIVFLQNRIARHPQTIV